MPVSRNRRKKKKSSNPSMSNHESSKPQKAQSKQSLTVQRTQTMLYQGAIPPPEMIEKLAAIDPSFPNRLLTMAEEESRHRRSLEKRGLNASIFLDGMGVFCGFGCIAIIAWLAYQFMKNNFATEGASIAVAVMVGLACVFVLRKRPKSNDR